MPFSFTECLPLTRSVSLVWHELGQQKRTKMEVLRHEPQAGQHPQSDIPVSPRVPFTHAHGLMLKMVSRYKDILKL